MPDPIIADQTQTTPPPVFPEVPPDIPSIPQAQEPMDIPPMIVDSSSPKKKTGRIIATILGILLLVGAVGAGVVLVGQKQLFQQKAKVVLPCSEVGTCYPNTYSCANEYGQLDCRNGQVCGVGCYPSTTCTSGDKKSCTTTQNCPGEFVCGNDGKWSTTCYDITDNCPPQTQPTAAPPPACPNTDCNIPANTSGAVYCTLPGETKIKTYCCPSDKPLYNGSACVTLPTTTCTLTGSEICVGNIPTGPCYQGGQGNQYACYKLKGNRGKEIAGSANCTCPAPYTWGPKLEMNKNWCFNTTTTCDGQYPYAERCSLQPQQCTGATPTPPPPGETAQCLNIKVYDANWNQLTAPQLSSLKVGDIVGFTVSGTPVNKIDKARFTINGVLGPEVMNKKPETDEYYVKYTIPTGVTSFTVTAQIHHLTLGWF